MASWVTRRRPCTLQAHRQYRNIALNDVSHAGSNGKCASSAPIGRCVWWSATSGDGNRGGFNHHANMGEMGVPV